MDKEQYFGKREVYSSVPQHETSHVRDSYSSQRKEEIRAYLTELTNAPINLAKLSKQE